MKIHFNPFFIAFILAVLSLGCTLPVQIVTRPVSQTHELQSTTPEVNNAQLIATLSMLETQVADTNKETAAMHGVAQTSTPGEAAQYSSATPGPTAIFTQLAALSFTATVTPQSSLTPTPFPALLPCNRAGFVADITVPDGMQFYPGQGFIKIWRLRNTGACTWIPGYSLVFDHGYTMNGPLSIPLPHPVSPGEMVDVAVNLYTPLSDGIYQGNWMLQDNNGVRFGIREDAAGSFWVNIMVGDFATGTPMVNDGCNLVSVSPTINSTYHPNDELDMHWTVTNTSGSTWTKSAVDYAFISGTKMYQYNDRYDLNNDVPSGSSVEIIVDTKAPATYGYNTTTWGIVQDSTILCLLTNTIYVK